MFDITGHSDVQDASLTGEDVNVVDLGHVRRLPICLAHVSDGCHVFTERVLNRDFTGALSS